MQTVIVNGSEIPAAAIAAELQHHPADDVAGAWRQAATALVIRRLLLDECARQEIDSEDEEAAIRTLLAREIAIPDADAQTCRRYWTANRARFRTPDVYEAAHILFPAAPDDEAARATAKAAAEETLRELAADARKFNELARTRSACSSAANGGRLGQLTRGDLVAEIETFVFALEEGQISPVPIMTRYGAHVLRLDRRAAGQELPFESVSDRISRQLSTQSWQRAVSQYLHILAGRSHIEGIDVDGATTPLVQ
jgi:peptidyl-prolyl cis-trans isomerase C